MRISPLGRVEGDLDLKFAIRDGVVTGASTHATKFRGFEIILNGKGPLAGLIVTPRICGICLSGDRLAVADSWNNRVMEWDVAARFSAARSGRTMQTG